METTSHDLFLDDSFQFWKSITLLIVFLILTPVTIVTALFSLNILSDSAPKQVTESVITMQTNYPVSGVQVFASLPSNSPSIGGAAVAADARVEVIRKYLAGYKSTLTPHAQTLLDAADYYGLDFRLLPAIAMQESNLCKFIPADGHNCWGWGIHSEGTLGFESFDDAIWTVAKGLKEEYIDKGLVTPVAIMGKYTPQSNGSWARGVTEFMSQLE